MKVRRGGEEWEKDGVKKSGEREGERKSVCVCEREREREVTHQQPVTSKGQA